MQDLEKQIQELNERVLYLEKREQKRIRRRNITIFFNVLKVLVILAIIFIIYNKFNNTVVKPYREKMDFVEDKVSGVSDKVDGIEKYVKDSIQKINPFKN